MQVSVFLRAKHHIGFYALDFIKPLYCLLSGKVVIKRQERCGLLSRNPDCRQDSRLLRSRNSP